ncbi:MAG: hypothetical protein IJ640_07065 [Prevotella sp.]|nr:hypothetical protein [Prevotella sp.]
MKTFLIVYGILALVSYVVFYTVTEIEVRRDNKLFIYDVYHTNPWKCLAMAVVFPLTWVTVILQAIIGRGDN